MRETPAIDSHVVCMKADSSGDRRAVLEPKKFILIFGCLYTEALPFLCKHQNIPSLPPPPHLDNTLLHSIKMYQIYIR